MAQPLEILVDRAQGGDKTAFGEIYILLFDKIYRFLYASLRNRELSEDLAQNTFLRCWKSLSSYTKTHGSIQAFLFAIARNLMIDWYRKKKALPLFLAEQIPSRENIEEEAIRGEEKGAVWKAILHLPGEERQLIILRYFEEMPYEQIARIVGKQEGAVRVRVYRILKVLKKHLQKST